MGRPRAFTPEQELAVCAMYEQAERGRIVAETFGVSDQTIYRILEKHGIPRTHRHPKPQPKATGSGHKNIDRDKVCEMYESGRSVAEIAQRFGCSSTTIYHHLEKGGLYKVGERKAKGDALMPKMVKLHEQGMSDYEISERLGIGRYAVNKRLRKTIGYRGKGSNPHNGGIAYAAKRHKELIARLEALPDVDVVDDGDPVKVRCKKCGTVHSWNRDMWKTKEWCPGCREAQREQARLERERKEYEREQQLIAAREWRLSVPHICKECGEPFYSERDNAVYCCDKCRKRAGNRRAAERRRRRGVGAGGYRHRMRIKVTKSTYDRTVTLDAVYKKYRGRCCECGCKTVRTKEYDPRRATLDHIIALGNNGTHTWNNVQLLCSDCNSHKRDLGQMRLAI